MNNFKHLTIALQIHGINFVDKTTARCPLLLNLFQKGIAIVFFATLLFSFYKDVILISDFKNVTTVSISLGVAGGHYLTAATTYAILLTKRRSLCNFLDNLSLQSESIIKNQPKKIFFLILATTYLPYIISIVNIIVCMIYWDNSPYQIISALFCIATVGPIIFFCVTLGLFICYMLNSAFECFKSRIQIQLERPMDHHTWSRVGKDFVAQHKRLSNLVNEFNAIYSNIYLSYFIFDITLFIFLVRALNLNHPIQEWNYKLIPPVVQTGAIFLTQVMAVARVNSQILSTVYMIKDPFQIPLEFNSEKTTLSILLANSNLSFYIQQSSMNPAAITAGNVFIINKGTMLSVGATTLTYILVMYGNNN